MSCDPGPVIISTLFSVNSGHFGSNIEEKRLDIHLTERVTKCSLRETDSNEINYIRI